MAERQPTGRKRVATFSFKGVVAAQTKDAARSMRNAIEHICSVVIDTYRVCMDQSKSITEKGTKLAAISEVSKDLDYIIDFTKQETQACKVERVKVQMLQLHQKMEEQVTVLQEELLLLKKDPHLYQKVFDGLMVILEDNTNFLKLGHSVEQARVLDIAFEAVTEVRKLRDAADEDQLVNSAELASRKCVDLLRTAKRLVSVQEKNNEILSTRLDSSHTIMQSALPNFLQKCKEKIEMPTDDNIENQQIACQQLTSVLEEIISIVKEVRADYQSNFADQIIESAQSDQQKKLGSAVKNVTAMLAKLHATAEEAEKQKLQEGVVGLAKQVAEELGKSGDEDGKVEFVQAIKQGVAPNHKDFFQAQKRLSVIATKATKPQKAVVEDEGAKDMLEAAKDMLSALKGISSALQDAPELKGLN